ncbi:hypothetical protein PENTCL1PPCAC_13387, partial [Pristionchus entomophagus]
ALKDLYRHDPMLLFGYEKFAEGRGKLDKMISQSVAKERSSSYTESSQLKSMTKEICEDSMVDDVNDEERKITDTIEFVLHTQKATNQITEEPRDENENKTATQISEEPKIEPIKCAHFEPEFENSLESFMRGDKQAGNENLRNLAIGFMDFLHMTLQDKQSERQSLAKQGKLPVECVEDTEEDDETSFNLMINAIWMVLHKMDEEDD